MIKMRPMSVPWSEGWTRLLEIEDFGPAEAIEARERILLCINHNTCPACGARRFGLTRWDGPDSGIVAETIECLNCMIVWPPLEVLQDWDFESHPSAAPVMGRTIREVSGLARTVQAELEERCQ